MCLVKPPSVPAVQDPTKPQEVKQVDANAFGSTKKGAGTSAAGGSLLTGPSGVANSQLALGRTSLLGQ